ncbi:hypothetical protein HELRODRAFT_132940, partial [Helobdella robusta]|uniref:C2 domain-containing protein n=1 Tax=Helobdella robusta TaxID=6412 RepID=T1EI00_HELRO
SADLGGTSDPYCIVTLDNNRAQTNTVYKSVNPEWNRTFTIDIQDIHSAVEVTVVDENRSKKIDFLGKVAIPLLNIKKGQRVAYQLKDAKLIGKVKGTIELEMDYVYNPVRVCVCVCLWGTITIVIKMTMMMMIVILVVMMTMMIVITIIIYYYYYYNYYYYFQSIESDASEFEIKSEAFDREERKSLLEKFQALQEVCLMVQEILDVVASLFERIRNLFLWKSPWLTSLALLTLTIVFFVLHNVPLRYILLAWGIRKFSRRLFDPSYVDVNEIYEFINRLPSDNDLV